MGLEQRVELRYMEAKLTAGEMEELKRECRVSEQGGRARSGLSVTKTELQSHKNPVDQLRGEVEELKRERTQAFSAALGHPVGPFNADTSLVYTNVLTKISNAYSTDTGPSQHQ